MPRTCRFNLRSGPRTVAIVGLGVVLLGGCKKSVCPDCFDIDGLHIGFTDPEVGGEHPGLVLFSGWRNGGCQPFVACTGAPDVYLGDVRWGPADFRGLDWSSSCNKELIAFASGRSPQVETGRDGDVEVGFNNATHVPVTLWVMPGQREEAEDHAWEAERVYETLGTGLDLDIQVKDYFATGAPGLQIDGVTCRQAATISEPPNYESNSLNVYYVTSIGGNRAGVNCYDPDPIQSYQNIMFVNGGARYSTMQMAHEIGHALGLIRSITISAGNEAPRSTTEVDELELDEYLSTDNLMYSGGSNPQSLTLGQIYRMHFDALSWLNRLGSAHLSGLQALSSRYPLDCQSNPVEDGPCPPLTLHPMRGWP